MTVDQRRSRRGTDRVPDAVARYAERGLLRPFERTAGDEIQAVTDDPELVVDTALDLVDDGDWSVGIGVGVVELPLPDSTRAGRGPAFEAARTAVTEAKGAVARIAVRGVDQISAADADAVLTLLALLVIRRSDAGRAAVATMRRSETQGDAATELGISRQAVSQRLTVAGWHAETAARPTLARLLAEADRRAGSPR